MLTLNSWRVWRPSSPKSQRCAAFFLGALSVLAYAPFGLYPLIFLSLGGFYALLDQAQTASFVQSANAKPAQRFRHGAWLGAAFGFGLFSAGVSWIYVSLSTFGSMPVALAALATLLFCAGISIYPALVGALFVRFAPAGREQKGLFFAALWALSEWLRGWILTGFPWLAIGYSQSSSPLAGFAPLFGVYGVSFVCAFAASLCAIKKSCSSWGLFSRCITLSGLFLTGLVLTMPDAWTQAQGEPISVALLQGNVAQDVKWRAEKFNDSLRTYYQLAAAHPAQLTVLPETAIPAFLGQVPQTYLDEFQALAQRKNGDILFGVALGNRDAYANGAVSLGVSGEQIYRKTHLVPFGEYVPPGFSWFLKIAKIPMSNFTPGQKNQALLKLAGQKIAVNICYEDAFGEEIIRALPEAGLLVNLSNVAWFGDSLAPAQHLQIAQMRAIESGRMMLRATNTGMTAIIETNGRIQGVLPPFTRAALIGKVRAYVGATPYVRWGNAPIIVFATLLLLLALRGPQIVKQKKHEKDS